MKPKQKPQMRTEHMTCLYLDNPTNRDKFLTGFRQLLKNKFQKITNAEGGSHYTCGQLHDRRNYNWKPWQHLELYCRKLGLDDFAVRDFLEGYLGYKPLLCECQILNDEREIRKRDLMRQFGIDLDSGDVGLVD
jgi:hypothetical protein